jgi:hypothetical protein
VLTTDLRPNYDAELRRDADARGLELLARHELSFGQASLGNRVGRFAQLAVLGETTARYTDAVLYHLARAGSPLLYVQPFERSIALPGFLHVCLDLSRLAVGSSASTMRGPVTRARAMATRWR